MKCIVCLEIFFFYLAYESVVNMERWNLKSVAFGLRKIILQNDD